LQPLQEEMLQEIQEVKTLQKLPWQKERGLSFSVTF
jgi:hypothetical protein